MEIALEPRQDQWGNTVNSLFAMAFDKWIEDNQGAMVEALVKKVKIDDIVDGVAKDIMSKLKGNKYRDDKFNELLDRKVVEQLANMIAEKKMAEKD